MSGVTEITLPDALTSMLWLKDPAKLTSQVKKVGLRELMSTTLNEEIASKELIGEFETAISSLDDVSEEDYQILLESVAHQSGKRISEFNELAVHDKNAAKQQAIGIIEKEKTRKVKQAQRIKEAQGAQKQTEDVNHLLNERVRALEEGQAQSETEIEKLSSQIVDQKKFLKRALLWLLLGIILGGVGIWGFRYFSTNVSYIVNGVISLGGLWGFLSFLLNLYRTLRVK